MKFESISFQPSANVYFTRHELRLMMDCSRAHYDGLCKSLSTPGIGSFLYGWTATPIRTVNVTTRQLDTLMKVMEMARHLRKDKDKQDAFGIGLKLRRIWGALTTVDTPDRPGIKL